VRAVSYKLALQTGKEIILATSSPDGKPNAIVVICQGIVEGRILINACQMNTTLKNIKENKKVCIVVINKKEYYKIIGTAKIYASGKYFDISVKKNKGPDVKYAIAVDIEEVYDLDKVKKIV
jgi:predicted pyridoxine 5'-phosphate oxidase superfamily flavin-nucleotide-binding protein